MLFKLFLPGFSSLSRRMEMKHSPTVSNYQVNVKAACLKKKWGDLFQIHQKKRKAEVDRVADGSAVKLCADL